METELTKAIKKRLHYFRPELSSKMRTVRYADEVQTPTGFVDVIRFEDYIANNKSYCSSEHPSTRFIPPQPCKIPGNQFPSKECTGCVYHKHVYELGILTTCYEVKITVSDFKSPNGHNFHGNDNYYAVPVSICEKILTLVPEDVGVIGYYPDSGHMVVKKKCKRKAIDPELLNYLLYNALKKWVDGRCLE
jgi:hypothetical protein